jgi:hypothetical protein
MEFDLPKPPEPPKIATTTVTGKQKSRGGTSFIPKSQESASRRRFEPQILQKPKFQRVKKSSKTPTTTTPLDKNWSPKKITVKPVELTPGHEEFEHHFEHPIPVTGGFGHQEPQAEHLLTAPPKQKAFEPKAKEYGPQPEVIREVRSKLIEPEPGSQRKVVYFGPEPQPQSVFLGTEPPHPYIRSQQPVYYGPEYRPEDKTLYESAKEKLTEMKDATKEKLIDMKETAKEKLGSTKPIPSKTSRQPMTREEQENFVVVEKKPNAFAPPKEEEQKLSEPTLFEKTKEKIIEAKDAAKEKLQEAKERFFEPSASDSSDTAKGRPTYLKDTAKETGKERWVEKPSFRKEAEKDKFEKKPTVFTSPPLKEERLREEEKPSLYEQTKEKLIDVTEAAKEKIIETKERFFEPSSSDYSERKPSSSDYSERKPSYQGPERLRYESQRDRYYPSQGPERESREEPLLWHPDSDHHDHETIHLQKVLHFPREAEEDEELDQNQYLKEQLQQLKKKNAAREQKAGQHSQILKDNKESKADRMLRDQVIRIHFEGKGNKDQVFASHHQPSKASSSSSSDKKSKEKNRQGKDQKGKKEASSSSSSSLYQGKDKKGKEDKKAKHKK